MNDTFLDEPNDDRMMMMMPDELEEEDSDHDTGSVELSRMDDDDRGTIYSSENNGGRATENASNKAVLLGKRESKAVFSSKVLVFGVLLLSAVVVAVVTYKFTSQAEVNEFETAFEQDARKVLESLGASLDKAIAGVDAYVMTMLSYARDTNQTWPRVTIPDFEARSGKFLDLTKAAVFMEFILVTPETRPEWEAYTAKEGPTWAQNSIDYLRANNLFQDVYDARNVTDESIVYLDFVHDYSAWGVENPVGLPANHSGPMLPMWQSAPLVPTSPVYNWDLATVAENESVLHCIQAHQTSISRAYMVASENDDPAIKVENEAWADYFSNYISPHEEAMEPLSDFYYPMVPDMLDQRALSLEPDYDPTQHQVVGIMSQSVYWRDMIKGILPDGSIGVVAVFTSPCSATFTYEINGPTVRYLGGGDHHNAKYNPLKFTSLLQDLDEYNAGANRYSYIPLEKDLCPWSIHIYPSQQYEDQFLTKFPIVLTIAAVVIFAFTTAVFVFYDWWVEQRQMIVMKSALRSDAIVSSLFPSNVRARLYDDQEDEEKAKQTRRSTFVNKQQELNSASIGASGDVKKDTRPIADLFPEVSVLFADLVGFTAWSSEREPDQIFRLLEALYGAFDRVCKRRGVLKIETIGDCYLAACGLPEPRANHAVVLCRFAADIRDLMNSITNDLETELGPGTGNLKIRVGIHSGAVTAGILRTDKARFQLFGDTVNTAARMESNGSPNRIQVSSKTAEALEKAGKGVWMTKRQDPIEAKGKGTMETFWVEPVSGASTHRSAASSVQMNNSHVFEGNDGIDAMLDLTETPDSGLTERLIDFNAKICEDLIVKVLMRRQAMGMDPSTDEESSSAAAIWTKGSNSVRDEVVDTISLPPFQKATFTATKTSLEPQVVHQLHEFVAEIAHSYRDNPFHNFEHASHVTMSANKLMNKICSHSKTLSQQEVYIHSFGVAMDPLAQLAIIVAAIIHDVDHRGVPNPVLATEEPSMAQRYSKKSIAEQHSVHVAWEIFMRPTYCDLRACLFPTKEELARFRQLIVNAVIATDVFDPELKSMRNNRWNNAFSESAQSEDPDFLNRKGTIVLEHVIQASDISHCVQHWTIYQKWNRRLFQEMYDAFLSGRTDKDPSTGWYAGELWFFDNYVIPLAKKLKECKVFGASGHEYLDTAYENRIEWEHKGKEIVEEMKREMAGRSNRSNAELQSGETEWENVVEC
ncbi:Receptor-type guanylate cyclase gcy [Seminavis robusta]|uniref:Phosphodiesterase n=1 Tax=Seminavis robusta TaxID=568900 RepID=A0A9N8ECV9_9STRA|nr:Receptor-type guanylate cyclase gcy [Seminavis robusta]|eukprot:Sro938_g222300.1 Receptor-type guanylate cyclase gcy (1210) ;mRNA; r:14323-18706